MGVVFFFQCQYPQFLNARSISLMMDFQIIERVILPYILPRYYGDNICIWMLEREIMIVRFIGYP